MRQHQTAPFLILTVLLLTLSTKARGQQDNFSSRTSFAVNVEFFSQDSGPAAVDYLSDEQNDLFYQNPFFGVQMNYTLTDHLSLLARLAYTTSQASRNYDILFVTSPPPDVVTNFRSNYHFHNISLEPEAQLFFKVQEMRFFWSAGPVFSTAFLTTDLDGATHSNPSQFSDYKHARSTSFGLGARAATGVQYFLSPHIGFGAELGYKYLRHNSLHTVNESSGNNLPLHYELNTHILKFGIVFKP